MHVAGVQLEEAVAADVAGFASTAEALRSGHSLAAVVLLAATSLAFPAFPASLAALEDNSCWDYPFDADYS